MKRINDIVKNEKCPVCGGEIVLVIDSDEKGEWIHEIYRRCDCDIIISLSGIRENEKED